MAWRLAKSLAKLRNQINELSPNRNKASDGTIGDTAHSSRASDHNPDKGGVVRGMDITHDTAHGIDSEKLAEALLASRDPRVKYVISNRKIASGAGGPKPWVWRKYTGKNPHNHHVHISVVPGAAGDRDFAWNFPFLVTETKADLPVMLPRNPLLVKGNKGYDVERLQTLLNSHGAKLVLDADFGDKTELAVKAFQRKHKLTVDGKVGPNTWDKFEGK